MNAVSRLVLGTALLAAAPVLAKPAAQPAAAPPEARAAALVAKMTREEKLRLVFGQFASLWPPKNYSPPAEARFGSAGYVGGIARLGIPPQWQTDAGIGVATQGSAPVKRERTALPSGLAIAATWDPAVAFAGGAMIGSEARDSGFNVMLAGGVNLMRDPRNGRNFEYGGEDPLLAGTIVGNAIAGIQSNAIISTVKHYAFNDQETGRQKGGILIDDAAGRQSDLLAFQIAIETGRPGAAMCSYNRVNGAQACESAYLLSDVLRRDWGWRGYVMSDWGAMHSTVAAARAGLDQQSGNPFDKEPYFGAPLAAAIADGGVPEARLDEMATRIVWAMASTGAIDRPPAITDIDYAAHARVTRAAAADSLVLLKNTGDLLPLVDGAKRIAIIGGHADKGVLAGGGSSLVYPRGGNAVPGLEPARWPGPVIYYPSSPMAELKARRPGADLRFDAGADAQAAAALAKDSDVAIVFVTQWATESQDVDIALDGNQDALVTAVAAANPRTIVVVESGGPVLMPWADKVPAILAAWYPGTAGGAAIADVLTGAVNPSGHLPASFPRAVAQLPRPDPIDPKGLKENDDREIRYDEGAAIGYKWYDKQGTEPLFPFGHGLSYTRFAFDKLSARPAGEGISASFRLRNTGKRRGRAVAQLYVAAVDGGWEAPRRLAGWTKLDLAPGATRTASVTVDPRLLATWDSAGNRWTIAGGTYRLSLGASSRDLGESVEVTLPARTLPAGWRPDQSQPRAR